MNKYIAELIEIDADNKNRVKAAEEKGDNIFKSIKEDEEKLSDRLWKDANSQVEKIKKNKQAKLAKELGDIDTRIKKTKANIDQQANEHYQTWLNDLFKKVIE
ncbi:MAG: hypothetical protein ACK5G7_03160 [Erysipelotrichaceae bacterium]